MKQQSFRALRGRGGGGGGGQTDFRQGLRVGTGTMNCLLSLIIK